MKENTVFYHLVNSDVRSCWGVNYVYPYTFPAQHNDRARYTLRKFCTVYNYYFSFLYHVIALDGEWIHVTC